MLGHLGQCHLPPHNLQIKNFERISVLEKENHTATFGEILWQLLPENKSDKQVRKDKKERQDKQENIIYTLT